MKLSVIITAGGIGKRMGSTVPKQFIIVNGKPILAHTIEQFLNLPFETEIFVTLPSEWKSYWNELCQESNLKYDIQVIDGGKERFHSIQNAVQITTGNLIAVHDGVRPLISRNTILDLVQTAQDFGNAIPTKSIVESLREKTTTSESKAVDRSNYFTVQTPQVFQREMLVKAYNQTYQDSFTDDASLVEALGEKIHCIEGNPENIKITSPSDIQLLTFYLNLQSEF